jgi:hypothetical protein
MNRQWLMLNYQLPREPSAPRVQIWRKLKKIGALLIQDTFWVLPLTSRNTEYFRWLAAEVMQQHGTANLWSSTSLLPPQDTDLETMFLAQIEPAYQELLEAIDQPKADLIHISKQYVHLTNQDHLQSKLGLEIRALLLAKSKLEKK